MSAADGPLALPRTRPSLLDVPKRLAASPRFLVYVSCTFLVVLTSFWLGKAMGWDAMDYHVYAGFSALHDRFGQDYFAAGPQGYFNPYAYVPFYLLLRSPLTALEDASILAVLQGGILWLTYELAIRVVPPDTPKIRVAVGALATVFAFANPVLIDQFGSSLTDVTTGEIALAGWLVLLGAVCTPGAMRVVGAALLLGAASALKPTNAVHAVSAATVLLFIPGTWRSRFRFAALFAVALAAGFVLINAPWSIHLERHFGNPVFPLLNGLFRSPEYSTASMLDHRFIPTSLGAALLRPFAMIAPVSMVDFELAAPDLRYAVLLVLALLVVLRILWRRIRGVANPAASRQHALASRALAALGCAFLVDWVLWLTASGNGRYFIPAACVAAVLDIALIFRLFAGRPAARNYVLAAIFLVQFFQLYAGTDFRSYLPWVAGPWYGVSAPARLDSRADLYFMVGTQTNSYIIPDLPAQSGFVNLDGAYVLGPHGPNGRRIESLIRRYAPNLRVLWAGQLIHGGREAAPWDLERVDDALEPFGLKADAGRCSTIVTHGIDSKFTFAIAALGRPRSAPRSADTGYLATCQVSRDGPLRVQPLPGQRAADLAFDHLENACPALFQPSGPNDMVLGDAGRGYVFVRYYPGTGIQAWTGRGALWFQKLIGGTEEDAGPMRLWESSPPRVACGLQGGGFLKRLSP